MSTEKIMIDARKDGRWFEKAREEMKNLRPLHLVGDLEQIAEFLKSSEFLQYKSAMNAKAGKWKAEGTLTVD